MTEVNSAPGATDKRAHNFVDLSGQKFERLTVVSLAGKTEQGQTQWRVRCDCGSEKVIPVGALRKVKSCGCWASEEKRSRVADITGRRFGRLSVLSRAGTRPGKAGNAQGSSSLWRVRCDCGTEKVLTKGNLRGAKSCGCWGSEVAKSQVPDLTGTAFRTFGCS
jgi:hypothetical protein